MNSPQVDIIIITYNQEKYVSETIAAAVNQSYCNTKIIIADDASTDSTRKTIEKWGSEFPDKIITVFNHSNLGITGNSNSALSKSTGDYFIILGGDDLLYPKRIEAQVKWFTENPNAVLCGSEMNYIDANSSLITKYKPTKHRSGKGNSEWIKRGMLYGTISIMYKKSHAFNLKYDERLSQVSDLKYCIDFLGKDGSYGFLDMVLSGYRKTDESFTVANWQEALEDCNQMFEILKNEANPGLLRHIKKGQNYLVRYSRGMVYFNKGNYLKSLSCFLKVLKADITNWRAFVRTIQIMSKVIFRKG